MKKELMQKGKKESEAISPLKKIKKIINKSHI